MRKKTEVRASNKQSGLTLLSVGIALCGAMLLQLITTSLHAEDVTYGQSDSSATTSAPDQQDCEQQDRAYVALLACSRLLKAPDLDAAQRTRIYALRGRASLILFDFGEAVQDFTEVLKVEPDNLPILAGRAEALNEHGSHANAAKDWAHIVALKPADLAARLKLGKSHYMAGAADKAAAAYEDAVKLDEKNPEAHIGLAKAYEMLKQPEKADASFAAALKINPANASALYAQGEIAEARGNNKFAIESYSLSLKANGMQIKPRQALQRLGVETPP
jgi:tetratricopeptide (TPR) repeat protein